MTDTADIPIACTLTTTEQAAQREHISREVLTHVREITELPDGYVVHVDGDPDRVRALAEFVAFEHACCPFLRFRLDVDAGAGPARLHLTGPGETKAFLRDVLLDRLPPGMHASYPAPGRRLRRAGLGLFIAGVVAALCCVSPVVAVLGLGAVAARYGGYFDVGALVLAVAGTLLMATGLVISRRRRGRGDPSCGC